ncbi:MAG: hypothetical protein EOO01_35135 [Chitinophagaceae bacterium]|nr:MAG: hypothetical protein EOO01_35135 [Chitinophagaceae bacterium]
MNAPYDGSKRIAEWFDDDRAQARLQVIYHDRLISHLKQTERLIPSGACVFSIKPTVVSLYQNRSSFIPPKVFEDDGKFAAGIKKCRYVYALPFSSPSFNVPLYPLDRLGSKAKVISTMRMDDSEDAPIVGSLIEIEPE